MVVMFLAFLLALFLLPCILMPEQVWKAFNVGDDTNNFGLHKINLVALGIPVHESGPPICMAKLIMLRHKINQSGQKKRSRPRHTRSPSRTNMLFPQRPRTFAWMKFGKQMR
ncbi:uncharacterized protein FOMMEDRAFT_158443 [Fomitiporia mediterranea MF3/22]|uniref:uncharacterized protein n=1 Tax=Fomitiporia mediterranea (strain MF3/22) TaxID=694068 RepID=UPI0004408419|nr:uncharacterized protein FOMMEDRAFT_158443 [Fomitiporia mediterranea MF3/22]EJD01308.1 hypothetical protein FOMMEDRAFT_158443 [Fomitiporia mediterranea MF3/22]